MFLDHAQNVAAVPNNGSATMVADGLGRTVTGTLSISYRGSPQATITAIDRTGSNDFSITGPSLPFVLDPSRSTAIQISFTPSASRAQGRITIAFTEGTVTGALIVNLNGTAPEWAVSYTLPGGNATLLTPGATLEFPAVTLNTAAPAVIAIMNRGQATGAVGAIRVTGAAFQASGLPLPPTAVDPGRDLRFNVSFTPQQREPQSGTLEVDLGGSQVTFLLRGAGRGPSLVYQFIRGDSSSPVLPDQTVTMADTAVGDRSFATFQISNQGNGDGSIAAINLTGTGFQLADLPVLPLTLAPGATAGFTLVFAPTQPGVATARVRIGSLTFPVEATALGSALTYSYTQTGGRTPLPEGGTLLFSPVQIGRRTTARFQISSGGTAAATISNISLTAPSAVFRLEEVPALPLVLPGSASVEFTVSFAPIALGTATATLRVDGASFTLSGTAGEPAPLPSASFEGPSATQQPLQQPSYTLNLAEPYPLTIVGTVTLAFNSEVFANDATVQFAAGGRSVPFTIPANTTRAVFPNNASQIRLQTGTVAGTISLTASFATEGGVNLTPVTPPAISLAVARGAPQITSVQLGNKSANSLTLLVSGYSTSRSVSQMSIDMVPIPGVNMQSSRFTLNVESAFVSWYQNAQSQQFGSLFSAAVPITMEGAANGVANLVDAIQTISVSLGNPQGTSSPSSVDVR
jgi:hypothetical protein